MRLSDRFGWCIVLALAGCGDLDSDPAWVTLRVGAADGESRVGLLASNGLESCTSQLHAVATRRDEGAGRPLLQTFDQTFLNWFKYFGVGGDSLLSAGSASLALQTGVEWEVGAYGSVVLRGKACVEFAEEDCQEAINAPTNFAGLSAARLHLFSESPPGLSSTSLEANWSCGSLDAWNPTNVLDKLYDGTAFDDQSQIMVPLTTAEETTLTLDGGAARDLSLTMVASRLPFGAYSTTSFFAEGLGEADGSGGFSITPSAVAPFLAESWKT